MAVPRRRLSAGLVLVALAVACGGRTTGDGSGSGSDSGSGTGVGTGSSMGSGGKCVSVEITPYDTACSADDDCTLTVSGAVCAGQCGCGSTPVNMAAASRIESQTSGVSLEGCPCVDPGEARCLGGQCTLCGFGPKQPGCAEKEDGGDGITDGGFEEGAAAVRGRDPAVRGRTRGLGDVRVHRSGGVHPGVYAGERLHPDLHRERVRTVDLRLHAGVREHLAAGTLRPGGELAASRGDCVRVPLRHGAVCLGDVRREHVSGARTARYRTSADRCAQVELSRLRAAPGCPRLGHCR